MIAEIAAIATLAALAAIADIAATAAIKTEITEKRTKKMVAKTKEQKMTSKLDSLARLTTPISEHEILSEACSMIDDLVCDKKLQAQQIATQQAVISELIKTIKG